MARGDTRLVTRFVRYHFGLCLCKGEDGVIFSLCLPWTVIPVPGGWRKGVSPRQWICEMGGPSMWCRQRWCSSRVSYPIWRCPVTSYSLSFFFRLLQVYICRGRQVRGFRLGRTDVYRGETRGETVFFLLHTPERVRCGTYTFSFWDKGSSRRSPSLSPGHVK